MDDLSASLIISSFKGKGKTLATAESCTGGGLGQRLTSVSGSSAVYKGGVISYCNEVKHRLLGVDQELLDKFGAVSAQVAEKMASGVRAAIRSDIGIAITGLAGPESDGSGKPVGLVYIGISNGLRTNSFEFHFFGDRETIRAKAEDEAFLLLLAWLAA